MDELCFRAYEPADRAPCLALFDANCPAAFAPNERDEYAEFLDAPPDGYEVCVDGDLVVGAFGLVRDGGELALRWILIAPDAQGRGLGAAMMRRTVEGARRAGFARVRISASQVSAPFFARFGANEYARVGDGWGPGMDRVEMALDVETPEEKRRANALEVAILERLSRQEPSLETCLSEARVVDREYSGSGSFTTLRCEVPEGARDIVDLDARIGVPGVRHGLAAILFLRGDGEDFLEIYAQGDNWDGVHDSFAIEDESGWDASGCPA